MRQRQRAADRRRHLDNAHLAFAIDNAAGTVAVLWAEGRTVLLHCLAAQSRTPVMAARYGTVEDGRALDDVIAIMPAASPNPCSW